MIYFKVFWYNLRKYFAYYPFEFIANVIRRIISLTYIFIFWTAVQGSFDVRLLGYFVFMGFLSEVLSGELDFASNLEKMIASGSINNLLIRPVNPIYYCLAEKYAKYGSYLLFQGLVAIIFIIILGINSFQVLLFFPALILGFVISTSINVMVGSLAFKLTITKNIRQMMSHIFRLTTGLFVPIAFFPEHIQNILNMTPLPYILNLPANILLGEIPADIYQKLLISLIFSIIFFFLAKYIWNRNLRSYEAFGI